MVFSFFKKQDNKMPERPAARPRSVAPPPEAKTPPPSPAESSKPAAEPLADLEFMPANLSASIPLAESNPPNSPAGDADFDLDDFDRDFAESSILGIDVDQDVDPLQAGVEQVAVLFANGQDGAARSLLETFVRSYPGSEGKRFWLLLFDLLQITGDRPAFEKLGVEYAESCETSPPTWREDTTVEQPLAASPGAHKIILQGVLTAEGARPVAELAGLIARKDQVVVDCSKLAGCDDEMAGQLAELLMRARQGNLSVALGGVESFMGRLNSRLVAGEMAHEAAWRLLLELLQRHGSQEQFEERAVDYAVTFELSPPSWEPRLAGAVSAVATPCPSDDAHCLSGELKGCRFEDLIPVIEAHEHPILDFSRVARLDFISAGQLVNRLAPYTAAGRDIIIRSPNHLVAALMAVVGLNKMARIIVPKS